MAYLVERKGADVVSIARVFQPFPAGEVLDDDHPDILAFRQSLVTAPEPEPLTPEEIWTALETKGLVGQADRPRPRSPGPP